MNLLEVKNICKTYGSGETAVKALKDVSFSVPKGEYVAVVGESGSGKSTLAKHINALLAPSEGSLFVDGMDVSKEASIGIRLSYCQPMYILANLPI